MVRLNIKELVIILKQFIGTHMCKALLVIKHKAVKRLNYWGL
jgi:hypothetical protein